MGGAFNYTIQPEANIQKQSGGLVFYYVFRYIPNWFYVCTILFGLLLLLLLLVAGIPITEFLSFCFTFYFTFIFCFPYSQSKRSESYIGVFVYSRFWCIVDTYWNAILIVRQTYFFFSHRCCYCFFENSMQVFRCCRCALQFSLFLSRSTRTSKSDSSSINTNSTLMPYACYAA